MKRPRSKDQRYRLERARRLVRRSIVYVRKLRSLYGRDDLRPLTLDEAIANPHAFAVKVVDAPGSEWHGREFWCELPRSFR